MRRHSGIAMGWAVFRGPEFQAQKMCTWVKLLTDLQILGRELHKNAFGSRTLHRPAVGAISLPQAPSRNNGEGTEGRERKRVGIGTE